MLGPPSLVPEKPFTFAFGAIVASPVDRIAKLDPFVGKKLSESATAFGVPNGGTVTKCAPASVEGSAAIAAASADAPASSGVTGVIVAASAGAEAGKASAYPHRTRDASSVPRLSPRHRRRTDRAN